MDETLSKRELNKAKKKALIINTAERLFVEKDFVSTSMDEIANAAGLTKRTVYKYFINKEDLFYAIIRRGAELLDTYFEEAFNKGNNALEKIHLANKAYLQFYTGNQNIFRLWTYMPSNKKNCEASINFCEAEKIRSNIAMRYIQIIEEGKADGSINKDLNTKQAVFFLLFSSTGYLNTIALLDKVFWDIQEIDEDSFIKFGLELFTDVLK